MLAEKIENPIISFIVTEESGVAAFLRLISSPDAGKFGLMKRLVKDCPTVPDDLSPEAVRKAFEELRRNLERTGQHLAPCEMNWIAMFIDDPVLRRELERAVFRAMLEHGGIDPGFEWTIGEKDKKAIAAEIVDDSGIGPRRRMEIAEKYGLPSEAAKRDRMIELLMAGRFDEAGQLGDICRETIDSAMLAAIDRWRLDEALRIARRFELKEAEDEILMIRRKLQAFR